MYGNKRFYLTAHTADGFRSFFDSVYTPFSDERLYLVVGASSLLRSDFIKSVAKILCKEGFLCEKILSTIDENKLTGAIFEEIGVYIFDADCIGRFNCNICDCTQYIVNLGEICAHADLYEKRDEVFSLYKEKDDYSQRCSKFLCAGISMRDDTQRIAGKSLNAEKLEKYVTRFVKKEFGEIAENAGKLSHRFVAALSPDGIRTEFETITNECARVYVLDDSFSIVSDALINQIKDAALSCGYDVTLCHDFIDPGKARHVIIPQLSLCFFTSDPFCKWDGEYTKKVNFTRFVDRETVKSHRNRIKFNNDAIEELVCQACVNLELVKCAVDRLDDIYENCCEREKLNDFVETTVNEILHSLKVKEVL